MHGTTRRQFFQRAGLAGAALGAMHGAPARGVENRPQRASRESIEAEMRARAGYQLAQRYLVADYYRIRRKLAYPLPFDRLIVPEVPAPTIPNYPWSVWVLWALEERVLSLGWAAEWFQDSAAAEAAARDLQALAQWPAFRQLAHPDLGSAHAAYILWTAYAKWTWPDQELRAAIESGCRRHAEELAPLVKEYYGGLVAKEDFLALPEPHKKLHNIPYIGTVGAALTASIAGHGALPEINRRLHGLIGAVLDQRDTGYTEGVGYDGYVLAFTLDWLKTLPEPERAPVLDHRNLRHYLEESYMLAAPGAAEVLAELSDVEPREMPWHLAAQAKLQHFRPDPVRAWHLSRCTAGWLRADGLAAIHELPAQPAPRIPEAGALDAHYALVLRSGWEDPDLAAVASCTSSPMGHLQEDNGTILIGTRGKWFITDPGYQQYMKDDERTFTLGPAAHNYPLVNGAQQSAKAPKRVALREKCAGVYSAAIDLTACYPPEAGLEQVVRTLWLHGQDTVVVADQLAGPAPLRAGYHWHGHPDAAWWVADGWALVHLPEADLWFTSPQAGITENRLLRLPGSRGQLTLSADAEPAAGVVWWVFAIASKPPEVVVEDGGKALRVGGAGFQAGAERK